MKINFTQAEYRTLIEMIFLGEWMLTAHDTQTDPDKRKYAELVQKIYSLSKEMGCESVLRFSKERNGYFPTLEFEDGSGVMKAVEKYNGELFWDELVARMTERDVYQLDPAMSKERPMAERYFEIAAPIEELYTSEFASNGLTRLKISET